MNWGSLEKLVSGVNKYSTAFGRVWLSVVLIFRILVFLVVTQRVWGDDDKEFLCNTAQPGCHNVCYNYIFPISPVRLWALQLIFISCPSLMVVCHVEYREMKNKRSPEHLYAHPEKKRGGLWWTYLVSLIFKAGFDAGFLYILNHIYKGYDMPRMSKCSEPPCPNTVDCYLTRPTEKKIVMLFMVVSTAVCIFMCICEMVYLIFKRIQNVIIRKYEEEKRQSEESHEMMSLGVPKKNFRSRPLIKVDPTASNQSLNYKKVGGMPTKI